jgi:hypothetical protein
MSTPYFSLFPKILYTLDGNTAQVVTDFMRRVSATTYAQSNSVIYTSYTVNDGETPEYLADQFYNDPDLYWVILIVNGIINPYYDWVLSYENLLAYCQTKYINNIYGIHHYVNAQGLICDNGVGTTSVTNYDYEDAKNEKKRDIKILIPSLVQEFVKEFTQMINQ